MRSGRKLLRLERGPNIRAGRVGRSSSPTHGRCSRRAAPGPARCFCKGVLRWRGCATRMVCRPRQRLGELVEGGPAAWQAALTPGKQRYLLHELAPQTRAKAAKVVVARRSFKLAIEIGEQTCAWDVRGRCVLMQAQCVTSAESHCVRPELMSTHICCARPKDLPRRRHISALVLSGDASDTIPEQIEQLRRLIHTSGQLHAGERRRRCGISRRSHRPKSRARTTGGTRHQRQPRRVCVWRDGHAGGAHQSDRVAAGGTRRAAVLTS
jgi:hypothetical protein